jgi:putative DNA primase/helicase
MMENKIGDESIFLRIDELKKGKVQLTDATNARRLFEEHGKDIRYIAAWKKWIVWNGKYWDTDEGGALVHEKGLEMIRNIYDELLKTDDPRERMEIEKYGIISESTRRRESLIKAAQWITELNVKPEELDINPWLLNVRNGTVDVASGEFKTQCQKEMITKIANVEYNPNADCPKWKKYVREIMDYKAELIEFLQTAIGRAITGDISEQIMFILFGTGANGKSTFLNTIMYLLGDYATATPTETFMKKKWRPGNQ